MAVSWQSESVGVRYVCQGARDQLAARSSRLVESVRMICVHPEIEHAIQCLESKEALAESSSAGSVLQNVDGTSYRVVESSIAPLGHRGRASHTSAVICVNKSG